KRRRHAEVVHRQADDDGIRLTQLGDQRVRVVDYSLLVGRARLRPGEERAEARGIEMRDGVLREIADDDFAAAFRDELVGERSGLAAFAEKAGVQLQGGHEDLLCRRSLNYPRAR